MTRTEGVWLKKRRGIAEEVPGRGWKRSRETVREIEKMKKKESERENRGEEGVKKGTSK